MSKFKTCVLCAGVIGDENHPDERTCLVTISSVGECDEPAEANGDYCEEHRYSGTTGRTVR